MEPYSLPNIVEKYGKDIDMRKINRDTEWILEASRIIRESAEKNRKNGLIKIEICPLCGADKFEIFCSVYHNTYNRCGQCESLFSVEHPLDFKSIYEDSMTHQKTYNDDVFQNRVEMIAKPKVEFISSVVGFKDGDRWFDIACGIGEIIMAATKCGWDACGCEGDPYEVNFAKSKGLNVEQKFIDFDDIAPDVLIEISRAKIVSLFNILEHVGNPRLWVKSIAKQMQKNNFLVIEVPRTPSMADFACATNKSNNIHRHLIPHMHLHIFSEKALNRIFEENGLKMIAKWCFGQGMSDVLTNAFIAGEGAGVDLYNGLFDISNKLQKEIDASGFADVILAVAIKK